MRKRGRKDDKIHYGKKGKEKVGEYNVGHC